MVALKHIRFFRKADEKDSRQVSVQLCREVLLWQRLRHPHIVPLIGVDTESFPFSLCMVSPWMKYGTVIRYLRERGTAAVIFWIREIAQGLVFLHEENIVHGDLRGANILVDDNGHACLTDFGLAISVDAPHQEKEMAGSARWMAPEMIQPKSFGLEYFARTPASDIYAFGCVCLELYTGHQPFEDVESDTAVLFKVIAGDRPSKSTRKLIPDRVWDIVQKCWSHHFADRPSIRGVVLELDR
ncbi:kinase-like domain-containing protein, partial [Mycena vulgaris]